MVWTLYDKVFHIRLKVEGFSTLIDSCHIQSLFDLSISTLSIYPRKMGAMMSHIQQLTIIKDSMSISKIVWDIIITTLVPPIPKTIPIANTWKGTHWSKIFWYDKIRESYSRLFDWLPVDKNNFPLFIFFTVCNFCNYKLGFNLDTLISTSIFQWRVKPPERPIESTAFIFQPRLMLVFFKKLLPRYFVSERNTICRFLGFYHSLKYSSCQGFPDSLLVPNRYFYKQLRCCSGTDTETHSKYLEGKE